MPCCRPSGSLLLAAALLIQAVNLPIAQAHGWHDHALHASHAQTVHSAATGHSNSGQSALHLLPKLPQTNTPQALLRLQKQPKSADGLDPRAGRLDPLVVSAAPSAGGSLQQKQQLLLGRHIRHVLQSNDARVMHEPLLTDFVHRTTAHLIAAQQGAEPPTAAGAAPAAAPKINATQPPADAAAGACR